MLTATKSSRINISKENKTKSVAEILSKNIKYGDIIFLKGELGVGKTTFIKFLINFLQKNKNEKITEIPSPTFNIVNEYKLENLNIKHCDLYRVKNKEELNNLGIFENNFNEIIFIEWPEILKNYNLKNVLELYFEYDKNYKNRFLTFLSSSNISYLNEFK